MKAALGHLYISTDGHDNVAMMEAGAAVSLAAADRRLIIKETLKPGSSVVRVARKYDVNANQVFQ